MIDHPRLRTSTAVLTSVLQALAVAAVLAGLVAIPGCSYAQMHGYSVVRTDSEAEYRPGQFSLLPTQASPDGAFSASLEAGMLESVHARAPEFVPTSSADARFAVRVHVENTSVAEGRTHVRARIEVLDERGVVTSELRTDHAVEGHGDPAVRQIGQAFGARLAHYLRERERYHHW